MSIIPSTTQYLSDKKVASRYEVGRSTVWRWLKTNPGFPSPIKLAGSTRWRLSDLEQWEQETQA